MTQTETDNLAGLVERRHATLSQLRELGRRQLELIAAQEMSHLMTVLAAKQRVLIELEAIERGLDPFRGEPAAERGWRTPADRERCARLLADCESMLAEVVSQEKTSEAAMRAQRDRIAGALHHAHASGAARGAYAAETRPLVTHLDLSSET